MITRYFKQTATIERRHMGLGNLTSVNTLQHASPVRLPLFSEIDNNRKPSIVCRARTVVVLHQKMARGK